MRSGALALLAAAAFAQTAPVEIKDLRWRAPVQIETPAEYAVIEVRREMHARTESGFRDLRIIGPDGAPVAWAWPDAVGRDHAAKAQHRFEQARLLNRVVTPGGALQFVVTLGPGQLPHHAIEIETTDSDFLRKVEIETGASLDRWDSAGQGMIFRLPADSTMQQSLRVRYPDSTQRYLRVTIHNWSDPATLLAVTVDARPQVPEEWEVLGRAERPARSTSTKTGATRAARDTWALSFNYPQLAGGRLVVEPATERFARGFGVESSSDGKSWFHCGSGFITRAPGVEELAISVGQIEPRRIQLVSHVSSDPSIEIAAVRLEVPVRRIIFPARVTGEYRLYLGAPNAAMPEYDLPAILARSRQVEPVTVSLGEWGGNPDYVAPPVPEKPVSERFPWLLPGVLGLAVIAMGGAAFRLIRKAG